MFDKPIEDSRSQYYLHQKEIDILDHNGLKDLFRPGFNELTYDTAVKSIDKLYHIYPSVPKYQRKRFLAIINGIIISFGPDFEKLHRQKVS